MRILCLLFIPLLLLACQKQEEPLPVQPSPVASAPSPSAEPSAVAAKIPAPWPTQQVELAPAALPLWRSTADEGPTLVLFGFDPLLKPLPEDLRERAVELVRNGDAEALHKHGSYFRVEPVILPNQTLSAAIDGGLFSKICWVFPSKAEPGKLDLELFRKQMLDGGFFTPAEAAQLKLDGGIFSGTLRGLPFQAAHYGLLPALVGPLVVHVDLSFFQGLYESEVKTPLYDLIHQTANALLQSGWQPRVTTLSYSTLEGEIALETRFVMSNLAAVLNDPALLRNDLPQAWKLRAEALYAADMFSESKKLEIYRQAADLAPSDASAQYDLFQHHFLGQRLDQALEVLDRTVALDPGYAAAYLALADLARKEQQLPIALDLLTKAKPFFPHNPFVDLQRAELLLMRGDRNEGLALLEALRVAPWSRHYHADLPKEIAALHDQVRTGDSAEAR